MENKSFSGEKLRVAVLGASGYVGAELCRLVAIHPHLELVHALGRGLDGVALDTLWPHFSGLIELCCAELDAAGLARAVNESDLILSALPHGTSAAQLAPLFEGHLQGKKLIDLSGDFRLPSKHVQRYEQHYKTTHPAPVLMDRFVYGLTEWNLSALREADAVANPGCFATALGLMLAPLAHAGQLPSQVTVFAATGSTGSGKKPGEGTHHPSRAANYKIYKTFTHQHVPEVLSQLETLGATTHLSFMPASAPMTHGIFATAHLLTEQPEALAEYISQSYIAAPFVRVRQGSPELNHVVGSNFADIGLFPGEAELVIACALDNTMKGAASQAIQNVNVMMGWDQRVGLAFAPTLP